MVIRKPSHNTRSLAVKGHDIQGSPVKILTKIRVTLALNGLRFWGLRVTFENFLNFIRKLVKLYLIIMMS